MTSPDRIIFLDIDGPMIPYRCLFLPNQTKIMKVFDPVAVGLINNLCEEHDHKIVLHTSWVQIIGGPETLEHCHEQGLKPEHFHQDAFCDEKVNWRYDRVAKWLHEHPGTSRYAIVDDDLFQQGSYKHYPTGMKGHMVQVNYYTGFLFHEYNEVLRVTR